MSADIMEATSTSSSVDLPRRCALADARTVLPGMVPFGAMLGVTVVTTGTNRLAELIGGAAIYGGSAQLTAVTLLGRGLGVVAVVLAAVVVNARLLLYSAAIGHRFRSQPALFRWLAPHFIIDQTFLMASARSELSNADFRCYWRWLGGSVLIVWTGSIGTGILIGPAMPPLPHLPLVGSRVVPGSAGSAVGGQAGGAGGRGRRDCDHAHLDGHADGRHRRRGGRRGHRSDGGERR